MIANPCAREAPSANFSHSTSFNTAVDFIKAELSSRDQLKPIPLGSDTVQANGRPFNPQSARRQIHENVTSTECF